jgi:putative restriction endonuclease
VVRELKEGPMRAWMLLVFGEDRQYAGNSGYADDESRTYRYDSNVANSRQLAVGDVVVLAGRQSRSSRPVARGLARIEAVEVELGVKERFRCPACGHARFKARADRSPKYRCDHGHEFDTPESVVDDVALYESSFGDSYRPLPGRSADELREWQEHSLDGSSIRSLSLGKMRSAQPPLAYLDELTDSRGYLGANDGAVERDAAEYSPGTRDERARVMRQIAERRGQAPFRRDLIARFGARCAISGCNLVDLLEAAHISPYRGTSDNTLDNGLLLRADLHTLFDLDLLGIRPEDLAVCLHPTVADAGYREFDGVHVVARGQLSRRALESRWARFQARESPMAAGTLDLPRSATGDLTDVG